MTEVIRSFCWHQTLFPDTPPPPLPRGYIHVLNNEKQCIKSDLKRFLWNLQQMGKVIGLSVDIKTLSPGGCLSLPRGYIHVLNHEKKMYKIRLQRHFFKLATNEWSDKTFLLTSKLCPLGLSAPAPGLYTCTCKKSWKNVLNQTLNRFFLNLQQLTKATRCSCWHQNFVPKGLSARAPGLYV